MSRRSDLQALIEMSDDLGVIRHRLARHGWDHSESIATVTRADLAAILRRMREGSLSAAEMEQWANLVEGRDDLGLADPEVERFVYEAANPLLATPLDDDFVSRWWNKLRDSPES